MIIRHNLPSKRFTKLDRYVFTKKGLSDGAKVLYGYLCGLRNGQNFSDSYIIEALGISKPVLYRRKKELTDNALILMDQISSRFYVIYIGHTKMHAAQVKRQWEKAEDVKKSEANKQLCPSHENDYKGVCEDCGLNQVDFS